MIRRSPVLALSALLVLTLAGCAAPAPHSTPEPRPSDAASDAPGHGAVAGAEEVAEAPLHLVAIDTAGSASMLDLLDGTVTPLDPVAPPSAVATDGRYVFAASDTGVEIIDSGVWTWDHVDHFHFYRAEARAVGAVTGDGTATVSPGPLSTAGTTGLFFPGSGNAMLLDNAALARGEIEESLRVDAAAPNGLIVPLGDGGVLASAGSGSRADELRVVDADGAEVAGRLGADAGADANADAVAVACEHPAGTITTRVGVVVGCADGAVLAESGSDGGVSLERIAYPESAAAPATTFAARKGRPTVAGIGADAGVWLLDTRAREWRWIPSEVPFVAAAAVDDEADHVVTVGADGVVRVLAGETGEVVAATEPLLAGAPTTPAAVSLTVDANRAYVNDPAEGVVYEIDFADGARVARVLDVGVRPDFLVEVGR